ncbi:hypothetical protein [Paludisphaera mucosa]|uniref:Uncharacterized protein n=1 Tax=Paludisphaera mucosa TaxID=3030827 RepID=A0ABT6FHR8_9BACT|nr:hypothetical protein [Paludisphaera mucosa]MDG3007064.1 hypothetical protein [Paludisphaera mucosa]
MRRSAALFATSWFPPVAQSATAGLILGLIAIASGRLWYNWHLWILAHLTVGAVLGAWNAGRAWLCWLPLGVGLFLIDFEAVSHGWGPRYLSPWSAAKGNLVMLAPAAAGLAFGTIVRAACDGCGWFRDPLPGGLRILPRSLCGLLGGVAGLAVAFSILRWAVVDSGTIYAAGFDETKFRCVPIGASEAEVVRLLGPPCEETTLGCFSFIYLFEYTEPAFCDRKHWIRRIVLDEDKKVVRTDDGYDCR